MIKHIHIENFKCFKNFDLDLGPFNVLVGPNDSGKTSMLQAIRLAHGVLRTVEESELFAHFRTDEVTEEIAGQLEDEVGFSCGPEILWQTTDARPMMIGCIRESTSNRQTVAMSIRSKLETTPRRTYVNMWPQEESVGAHGVDWSARSGAKPGQYPLHPSPLVDWMRKPCYVRFTPSALKTPSTLEDTWLTGDTGKGFPTFLHNLLGLRDGRFDEIESRFTEWFPAYRAISIDQKFLPGSQLQFRKKGLFIRFHNRNGSVLPSEAVSDGAVLSLAYLTLAKKSGHGILLIEEPENGVHHAALDRIVDVLKRISASSDTQVILTTHSPYLLDLVEPEQVKVFSKQQDGTVEARTMSDHQEVRDMTKHFMSGTIWTELGEERIIEGAKGE
jgi:predicted ATPase